MSTETPTLIDLATSLQRTARRHHHRRVMLFSGEPEACREQARQVFAALSPQLALWVGASAPRGIAAADNREATAHLGRELDLLVYDAFCGLDPDALGALGGTLRGGGLLLLLTPRLEAWPDYPDPQREAIAVSGYRAADVGGAFLRRLAGILESDELVVSIPDGRIPRQAPPVPESATMPPLGQGECRTSDQQRAVEAIERVAKGHRRRPLVLSSDRGRGKSSAMGIAAARLLREAPRHIRVTAPRRAAVEALFEQAMRLLPGAELKGGVLHYREGTLGYSAADYLLAQPVPADLLLVDEAAALPTALLEGLLARYPRVTFATTLHGYEGTGRGFALRFKTHLDRETPQWRELRLETPVRWAPDDPLEPLLFRLLGLDANPASDQALASVTPDELETVQPDSTWLLDHEPMLGQLFGLLVLAHYRTTPGDFRLLLDAPNLLSLLLRRRDQVIGVALLSDEGGFDVELSREIWAGRRRPKGHLLAQSLAAHVGIPEAPMLKGLRIVRLAIHPAVQRRGLGSRMLGCVRDLARDRGFDYLGTSFGVSEGLFGFWHHNGLEPVRLGLHPSTSSGDHSVLMISPLSRAGEAMAEKARQGFARQLPALLGDPLRDLPAPIARRLLAASRVAGHRSLTADDWSDLAGFAFARRGYETSLPAIEKLTLIALGDGKLEPSRGELLVRRVLQKRGWSECAARGGLSGRAQTEQSLREIMAELIDRFADPEARLQLKKRGFENRSVNERK